VGSTFPDKFLSSNPWFHFLWNVIKGFLIWVILRGISPAQLWLLLAGTTKIMRPRTDSLISTLSPGLIFVVLGPLYPLKYLEKDWLTFILSSGDCVKKLAFSAQIKSFKNGILTPTVASSHLLWSLPWFHDSWCRRIPCSLRPLWSLLLTSSDLPISRNKVAIGLWSESLQPCNFWVRYLRRLWKQVHKPSEVPTSKSREGLLWSKWSFWDRWFSSQTMPWYVKDPRYISTRA